MLKWVSSLKLKYQITIMGALGLLAGAVLIEFMVFPILESRFSRLEQNRLNLNLTRVQNSFRDRQESMYAKMGDWARWTETYEFMLGKQPNYIKKNLGTLDAYNNIGADFITFRKSNGEYLLPKTFDRSAMKYNDRFGEIKSTLDGLPKNQDINGYFKLQNGKALLVSSLRITKDDKTGDNVGEMIVGEFVEETFLQCIRDLTQLDLQLIGTQKELHSDSRGNLFRKVEIRNSAVSDDPAALTLELTLSRSELEVFDDSLMVIRLALMSIWMVSFTLMYWMSKAWMLQRVQTAVIWAKNLDLESEENQKLPEASGENEIGHLERALNSLLDRVQKHHAAIRENSAKLIHTSKLASLREMSAGVAHEINNPLAVISGSLTLLQRFRLDENKFNAKIDVLFKAVHRIDKIVKGLKKFSRTHGDGKFRTVFLLDIVKDAMIFVEVKAKNAMTTIEVEIPENIQITCDPVEIEQVLVNMINNAVDAVKTLDSRWVKLIAREDSGQLILQVQDSGFGISKEIEAKLFDPFFTTKPSGEGTGLGLSITKGILDEHRASIAINRQYKNTCFEIRFARADKVSHEKTAA